MSVEVICTPYGPPAIERLGEQIAAFKQGDPLAPVTVVVPTNIAGLAARRALGTKGRGITAVNFLKLFDLAERLAGRKMAVELARKPLSDLEIGVAIRQVLDTDPGLFHASAHHPATEQALMRSYRDLRDISNDGLDKLAAQSTRAADVVRLCRHVRGELRDRWYDGQDLAELAIEALKPNLSAEVLGELGSVIVYLPQRVTKSQGRMVSAVAERVPVVVIAGLTGDHQADAPVEASVLRMGGALGAKTSPSPPHGQRIITAATGAEEVQVALREVVEAARLGIPLARIAVLCGGGPPVIRQVQEQFDAAGIEFNGPSGRTLADSLVGRGLLAMLHLKNRDFRRDEVFALLSAAFPTVAPESDPSSPARTGAQPAPVMAWEQVSRRAGVSRGADQWQMRLRQHADELRVKAAKEQQSADGTPGRVEWLNRQAGHADSLAQFMAKLERDLSPNPAPTTWKDWCQWVEGLIGVYLGMGAPDDNWPESEQQAAKAIREVIDRLGCLDDIEGRPRTGAFLPTLVSSLGVPAARAGVVGKGVFVGQVGDPLGMELERLIILGMAEGTFPHSPSDDPLLPDRERKAAGDDLCLLADQHHDQHRSFLAAMASARSTTLVYARGDARRASEQHPSRWLLDTATALAGRRVESGDLERLSGDESCDWFEHIPSFSGRVVAAEFPATDQEFRLRLLAPASSSDDHPLPDDRVLARGAELASARASDRFTRFDGNLSALDLSELTGSVMSPTSLEAWADCPMRYLFRHVLGVQTAEQPEELVAISALEKGSLVHEVLDEFMKDQLGRGLVPPPGQPWTEEQHRRLLEIGEQKCAEAEAKGLTGTPVYWHHDRSRIMADLDRFLREDNELRQQRLVAPVASELAFGMGDNKAGDYEAIEVDMPNGQAVRFRGQIDRVDQGEGGLLVTDYKIGKSDPYKDLDEGSKNWDPVQRGTRLQLPVYGLAARAGLANSGVPVRGQYWFVTGEQEFKTCGYTLDETALSRFRDALGAITEGIGAGVFCDRPQPGQTDGAFSQYCDYCNADRLGTEDRRRKWERMLHQDELAGYRTLAEPPEDDPHGEAD
ncbi:MAG: PD-(D/E)XK nuclease family protein [bacterium]|nr:PD-(D/E)XK nuclease family protein [bacterium]